MTIEKNTFSRAAQYTSRREETETEAQDFPEPCGRKMTFTICSKCEVPFCLYLFWALPHFEPIPVSVIVLLCRFSKYENKKFKNRKITELQQNLFVLQWNNLLYKECKLHKESLHNKYHSIMTFTILYTGCVTPIVKDWLWFSWGIKLGFSFIFTNFTLTKKEIVCSYKQGC